MVRRGASVRLGALALVLAAPASASASDCSPIVSTFVQPRHEARLVPTNTRFWIARTSFIWTGSGPPPELVLVGSDGTEPEVVESRIDLADTQELVVLTPREPLLPETVYQLWECHGATCSTLLTEITTGAGPDEEPPSQPVERSREGGLHFVNLTVDFDGILVASLGEPAVDLEHLAGTAQLVSDDPALEYTLGRSEGACVDNWPGSIETPQELRYGAFDLAGNFSGWAEAEPLALDGCGCTTGRPAPAGLLALLLAAFVRRRPRAR